MFKKMPSTLRTENPTQPAHMTVNSADLILPSTEACCHFGAERPGVMLKPPGVAILVRGGVVRGLVVLEV